MSAATWPRDEPLLERLLLIDPAWARFGDARVGDLPGLLSARDLLVVNDAATLPASLHGEVLTSSAAVGAPIEVRLVTQGASDTAWRAVLFGAGDWRTPTEKRPAPPRLEVGDTVAFDATLAATVLAVDPLSPRLVELQFQAGAKNALTADAFWAALYRLGRPIQYAYVAGPLDLWHVQTRYAARPWAFELPSAGRPLSFALLGELKRRGVGLATLTHAAGISSTGDAALDAALPLPERYDIPEATVAAIAATHRAGGRVIAVGTSVVRALEGCVDQHGYLAAGQGVTDLRIGEAFVPRVVDGLLTGLHEPSASHFQLLQAFASRELIERAYEHAERLKFLHHEFGDSNLILRDLRWPASQTVRPLGAPAATERSVSRVS